MKWSCGNCEHWTGDPGKLEDLEVHWICTRLSAYDYDKLSTSSSRPLVIRTAHDFFCTEWEPRIELWTDR